MKHTNHFLLFPQCPPQLSARFPLRRQGRVSPGLENKRNAGFRSAREGRDDVSTQQTPSVRGRRDIHYREGPRESCCPQACHPYWFVHQTALGARLSAPNNPPLHCVETLETPGKHG